MSMRESYEKMFITNLEFGNKNTYVHKFVIGKSNYHPVVITQFFILSGLRPCVNFQADVAHMLYGWSFSHYAALPVMF